MLGVVCGRQPTPWTLSPLTFSLHHLQQYPHHQHHYPHPPARLDSPHHHHALAIPDNAGASIWRAADGGGDWRRDFLRPAVHEQKGEGSWNVAWDARPARWLHRLDLSYLLLGVYLVLAHFDCNDVPRIDSLGKSDDADVDEGGDSSSRSYRVTGVAADGRCLFRAIAHGACLQKGEEAPDENRQRELADELRAQVVDELSRRREEVERFIEEDFDDYVKRIQQPYVWGGEPELLMASHVLKKLISVYMKNRSTGDLTKIANYGEEYKNDQEFPINVLFHGYGHYDILETPSN